MAMNNPERAIATLVGEVHGLLMVVHALAKTHSNPAAVLTELDAIKEYGLAAIEPHPVPETTILGFQYVVENTRRALRAGASDNQERDP